MERTEFERLHPLIAGLIRIVRLLWEHSMFYKMPARFIVLLQGICNLFIQQVSVGKLKVKRNKVNYGLLKIYFDRSF